MVTVKEEEKHYISVYVLYCMRITKSKSTTSGSVKGFINLRSKNRESGDCRYVLIIWLEKGDKKKGWWGRWGGMEEGL